VREAGLEGDFMFSGPVTGEAKEALYRQADLFVLPSFTENFSMVVAEALSYGIPVITTTGTPWRVLEEEQAGWWVAPRADALAGALRQAIGQTVSERRAMGERGRALAAARYAWPGIGRQMSAFYRESRNSDSCILKSLGGQP
jgi:glycosyltransferase involved in cell wall biosynthesis